MRNLVLILVALIAVATFIRAYEAPHPDSPAIIKASLDYPSDR